MASLPVDMSTVIDSDTRTVEGGNSAKPRKGSRAKLVATVATAAVATATLEPATLAQPSETSITSADIGGDESDVFDSLRQELQSEIPDNDAEDDGGSDFDPTNAQESEGSDEESDLDDTRQSKRRKRAAGPKVPRSQGVPRAKSTAAKVIVVNLPKITLSLDMPDSVLIDNFVNCTLKIRNREQFCRVLSVIDKTTHGISTRTPQWGQIFNRTSFSAFTQSARIIYILLDGDFYNALKTRKTWTVQSFDDVLMQNNSTVWHDSGVDLCSFFDFFVEYVHDSSSKQGYILKGLLERFEQDRSKTNVIVDRFNQLVLHVKGKVRRQSAMESSLDGRDQEDESVARSYLGSEPRTGSAAGSQDTGSTNRYVGRGRPRGSKNAISGESSMSYMQSVLTPRTDASTSHAPAQPSSFQSIMTPRTGADASTSHAPAQPSSLQIIALRRPPLMEDEEELSANLFLFDTEERPAPVVPARVEQANEGGAGDGGDGGYLRVPEHYEGADDAGAGYEAQEDAGEDEETGAHSPHRDEFQLDGRGGQGMPVSSASMTHMYQTIGHVMLGDMWVSVRGLFQDYLHALPDRIREQQENLVSNLTSLNERCHVKTVELSRLHDEQTRFSEVLGKTNVDIQTKKVELASLERRVNDFTSEAASKKSEIDQLKLSVAALKEENAKLDDSVKGLKAIEAETERSLTELDPKLDRLRSIDGEIAGAEKQLRELKAKIATEELEKERLNIDLRDLRFQSEQKKDEIRKVEGEIKQANDDHQKNLAQETLEHNARLSVERAQFEKEKADFQAEKTAQDQKVESHASDLLIFEAKNRQFQLDQTQFQAEFEQLRNLQKEVQANTDEVKKKLAEADQYVVSKRTYIDECVAAAELQSKQDSSRLAAQRKELFGYNEYLQSTYNAMCRSIRAMQRRGMERVERIIDTVRPTFPDLEAQLRIVDVAEPLLLQNFDEYTRTAALTVAEASEHRVFQDGIGASFGRIEYVTGADGGNLSNAVGDLLTAGFESNSGEGSLALAFDVPAELSGSSDPAL